METVYNLQNLENISSEILSRLFEHKVEVVISDIRNEILLGKNNRAYKFDQALGVKLLDEESGKITVLAVIEDKLALQMVHLIFGNKGKTTWYEIDELCAAGNGAIIRGLFMLDDLPFRNEKYIYSCDLESEMSRCSNEKYIKFKMTIDINDLYIGEMLIALEKEQLSTIYRNSGERIIEN